MECCRNILLPLVYEEAARQLEKAGAGARSSIDLADVLAYSLNRMAPLFMARESEWLKQYAWLKTALGDEITETVRKSILQARKPRLQSTKPLDATELVSPMLSLLRLREKLKQPEMTWLELPRCLENFLHDLRKGSGGGAKPMQLLNKRKESDGTAATKEEYSHYILPARFNMINAIEGIVYRLTLNRIDSLPPKLAPFMRLIRPDEVMAMSLSCLPPVYATTEGGMKRLRYHARMQIGSQIAEVVSKSVVELGQEVSRDFQVPPLIFQTIRQERQESIAKLNWMLKRKDVTWENAPQVVSLAIDELQLTGNLDWQRITPVGE